MSTQTTTPPDLMAGEGDRCNPPQLPRAPHAPPPQLTIATAAATHRVAALQPRIAQARDTPNKAQAGRAELTRAAGAIA